MIASRVAAKLTELTDNTVDIVNGGFGELRVEMDGRDLYTAGRLWYPRARTVVEAVCAELARAKK